LLICNRGKLIHLRSTISNQQSTIPMSLTLIGYRATGKTTLAKLLAARFQWDWIDADVEIERRAGKSIATIFAEDGEPAFRDLESLVIADLCQRDRLVIASGGGAPLREQNRRAMHAGGPVVWLTALPETILARMTGDATTVTRRPSLTDKSPLDEIVALLAIRGPMYKEAADCVVNTEGKTLEMLVEEIAGECGMKIEN
jgi:shikimate kinase